MKYFLERIRSLTPLLPDDISDRVGEHDENGVISKLFYNVKSVAKSHRLIL